MKVLLSILGVLALLCIVPQARSLSFHEGCPPGYYNCRMKCNTNEYAVRYCADWSICCREKKDVFEEKKKWRKV
ncbi:beta-defensin 43-like [Hippopotamus amphibius kiboko]|uniref:beta-defensin 43-like n=1 Tax=Hippopotamus amphibius kiboko TaxID=575201 RepID=UPI00259815AA|nr:beta-defensin 43-like [Hippopotamus amphibius kiboko]